MTKNQQYCQKDSKAFYFFRSCLFVRIRQKPPLPKKNLDLELNAILPLIDFSLLKGQKRRSSCQPTGGVTGAIFKWLSRAIFKGCLHPGGSFLFIDLMLHLSHLKQLFSQPIHLTHELKLCMQITRRRVELMDIIFCSENPCWHQVLNLYASNLDLLQFAAIHSQQDLAILMVPHGWACSRECTLGNRFSAASC